MKQVIVLSRRQVEGFGKDLLEKQVGKFLIVSIFSSASNGGGKPVGVTDWGNGMDICFDDLDWNNKVIQPDDILFQEIHAKQISDFIESNKDQDFETLICQCDAGISRSGAVGLWATRFLKLDEKEFRDKHPQIKPNSRVLEILMDVSGLKDELINFWKENT